MSLTCSEYGQLVNCKNSLIRSFSVTVTNDQKNVVLIPVFEHRSAFPRC